MTEEEQITTQETAEPCWYSNSAKAFFIPNSRKHFIQTTPDMFKKHLRLWGYSHRAAPDEDISQADQIMLKRIEMLITAGSLPGMMRALSNAMAIEHW